MSFLKFLQTITKSNTDCMLGGVCGGLGAHTPIPAWLWRVLFCVLVFFVGSGALVYVILWICLPEEKPSPPPASPPTSE